MFCFAMILFMLLLLTVLGLAAGGLLVGTVAGGGPGALFELLGVVRALFKRRA